MKITRRDVTFIVVATISLIVITSIVYIWLGDAIYGIEIGIAAMLILLIQLEIYRRSQYDYRQLESLFSLFFTLKPTIPLLDMRGWRASPDLLKMITEIIYTERPKIVVEAGSGITTLIMAYCLKQIGEGRVISLEHDPKYAATVREVISLHGLQELATINCEPLKEIEINKEKWNWYDLDSFEITEPIDFLVIDGPPGAPKNLNRYPALPMLFKYLNKEAIIILDDGYRKDVSKTVERWSKEFNDLTFEYLKLEKGAIIVHWSSNS